MIKKEIGCFFIIFLLLLHFFPIPSQFLFIVDIFAVIFIFPVVLKGFFYKISHKLFLSYFLIGFVPLFASFILIFTIIELGGVLYLQNQYEYSLRTWILEVEKDLLNLYLKPEPEQYFGLEKKFPKISVIISKEKNKYFFGCNEENELLEKNGWKSGNYLFSYKIGEEIIFNIPLKEILKKQGFFNIDLEWTIFYGKEAINIFKRSEEKNLLKKPLIYSIYFLDTKKEGNNTLLLMRSSIYSIYKSLSKGQSLLSKEIEFILKVSTVFLLLLTLLSFFYAGYLVFKSTRKITKLTRGVEFFSSGNLDHRIDVKGKDELSQLARNFNNMAESIKNYISKLKEKAEEEKELELASKIQKSLLPDEKSFSLFKKADLYFLPSRGIGGDWFDVFLLKNDKILLLIGDASGHGISASLTMAMAKAIIVSLVYRDTPPSCILQEVHSILKNTGLEGQFITLQIIEIDKNEKNLKFYNAGHPPAFLISKGKVSELRINSFPIGVFEGPGFDMISCKYEEGDRLLLYTDGLIEAEGKDFGIKDLKELIEKISKEEENFFSKLLESLKEIFEDENFIDDVTLLHITI